VLIGFVAILSAACVDPEPAIRVEGAWSRPTGSADMPGVVYVEIANRGGSPDRLVGARTDRCRTVEIHETRVVDDRMRMVPLLDGLEIPARSTVALEPGGLHMMLLGLASPLAEGERFEVRLELERSGEIVVDVEVRRR
jgi:copper(I)-binding protein